MSDLKTWQQSMQLLQQEANTLMFNSAYNRSLARYHTTQADDLDTQIDVVGKKIRNLEANKPKEEKLNEPVKESNVTALRPLGDAQV